MKEKIYTIPVNEVFAQDCECPLCVLERRIEGECIEYALGAALMEPDARIETNKKGFCHNHYELLFNSKINTTGLGLIMETHQAEQIKRLKRFENKFLQKPASKFSKKPDREKILADYIAELKKNSRSCAICDKINATMERYIDVVFYLWFNEPEFKTIFKTGKGFCLGHFRLLLKSTKTYLNYKDSREFIKSLIPLQLEHMERIEKEVEWFNKKSDYRNADAPWENSKDSVQRCIQKNTGYCDLE